MLGYTLKRKPADGATHWSSYKLAAEPGGVSVSTVQRIWRKHGVRPHRLERHMIPNDPNFETKAADVIGLYLTRRRMRERGTSLWNDRAPCCNGQEARAFRPDFRQFAADDVRNELS